MFDLGVWRFVVLVENKYVFLVRNIVDFRVESEGVAVIVFIFRNIEDVRNGLHKVELLLSDIRIEADELKQLQQHQQLLVLLQLAVNLLADAQHLHRVKRCTFARLLCIIFLYAAAAFLNIAVEQSQVLVHLLRCQHQLQI